VHQRVEFFLSRVEDHAATALRSMCSAPGPISPADRATLSMFFALLEGRTIAGLERLQTLAETTMQMFMASRMTEPETFLEDYVAAIGPDDPDTIERQRQRMLGDITDGRITLGNPKEVALDLMLEHVGDSAQFIFQLEWWLLESTAGDFVTSDRGLAMHDPTPPYPFSGHAILSSPNAQTTIPLDPRRCLLMRPPRDHDPTGGVAVHQVAADRVAELNLRTYGFASRYIFADSQETAAGVRREAKRRAAAVVRPRPCYQVMLIDAEDGDDRLAREHRARGWPEYIYVQGEPNDYVVLDPDNRAIERSVDLERLGARNPPPRDYRSPEGHRGDRAAQTGTLIRTADSVPPLRL
jgi:Protein of unknown function (DUF4238)